MRSKTKKGALALGAITVCASLALALAACNGISGNSSSGASNSDTPTRESITVNETIESSADGEHAIAADGTADSYSNIAVVKPARPMATKPISTARTLRFSQRTARLSISTRSS